MRVAWTNKLTFRFLQQWKKLHRRDIYDSARSFRSTPHRRVELAGLWRLVLNRSFSQFSLTQSPDLMESTLWCNFSMKWSIELAFRHVREPNVEHGRTAMDTAYQPKRRMRIDRVLFIAIQFRVNICIIKWKFIYNVIWLECLLFLPL